MRLNDDKQVNTWFRMYNEVHSDPKVQTLPPILFRAWVNLMCLANMNNNHLPPIREVAYRLHISEAKASEFIAALIDRHLFEKRSDGEIEPHNWNGRQFKSDVSTERVKRFRERHGDVSVTVDETFHETKEEKKESTKERKEEKTDSETDSDSDPPIVPRRTETRLAGYSDEFEIFWSAYPKKTGKGAAWIAWRKNGHPGVDTLVTVVERAKCSPKWIEESGRYIPNPATWLNQRRWDDQYVTVDEEREAAEKRHREIYGDALR